MSQLCDRWIYSACLCFVLNVEEQRLSGFRYQYSNTEWEVAVERPTYDLTIFKLHCGGLTLKIYSKDERVLRIEVIVDNARQRELRSLT